jgi:hypothetical protein
MFGGYLKVSEGKIYLKNIRARGRDSDRVMAGR